MDLLTKQENLLHLSISVDYKKGPLLEYLNKKQYPQTNVFHMPYWSLEELRSNYAHINGEFLGAIPFVLVLDSNGTVLYQQTEAKNYDALRMRLTEHLAQ